jgi:RNA polymerase sigma-70 factor (ECF subfamily)
MTPEEFEALYRSTAGELLGYLSRRAVGDAEDLAAEVYAIAWRRRGDLPPEFLRRAWLFGTARKLVLSESRRIGRAREVAELVASTDAAVDSRPGTPRDQVVAEALARLRPDDREIIRLVEWEGFSPAELAVALGIRAGTARVRLHRARQALAADAGMRRLVHRDASQAAPSGATATAQPLEST